MKPHKIIGLGGTNGSGKDTVAHMLRDKYGFLFVSLSELLREELIAEGKSVDRKHLRHLSAKWRREKGLGALVDKAVDKFSQQAGERSRLVVSSLRNFGEADEVHRLGGVVLWVDADPKIRYQRITGRQRDQHDLKSYEEFLKDESEEMHHYEGDHHTLSLAGVKEKADLSLENNFRSIDSFHQYAEKILKQRNLI